MTILIRRSALLLGLASGCTHWTPTSKEDTGCTPGDAQACEGDGGCLGTQMCPGSRTWNACVCFDTDSGTGGTTDSGADSGTDSGADSGTDSGADSSADSGADTGTATDTGTPVDTDTGPAPTSLDMSEITFFDNPTDLASWPETTEITLVEFSDNVHVEFSKQDGDDRWPDVTPPGWGGPLQYTLGLAEKIDGVWYGSAAIQYWYGLYSEGGNVALDDQIAVNWYYDGRWGTLAGRQPATGEIVGLFVIAGNVRGVTDGSESPVMERSNVVLMPFPGVDGATYTFP